VTRAELADRVALRDLVDAYGIAVDDRDAVDHADQPGARARLRPVGRRRIANRPFV
jgi:hypothetical protein